ncbi:MAG: PD-(D/E)XK nuclease family protein, partial [Verrucomicrobia bacterium]|nr:PD-(D/E)XK nuclease family protein [Verrucomicrobiota bacterium]
ITRIVLAAVLEPSLLVIKALERAAQHIPVDILIHAPASRADTFDAWGRPLPEAWQDCAIPIPHAEHHVILESTPIAQSTRVASLLRTHQTPAAIGVPDPNITPCVAAACADAGFTTFDPADRPLGLHPLTVLVTQISELCANPSYAALSNYLRHADALDYFCSGAHTTAQQLLTELDIFQNAFLPADVAAVMAGLTRAAAEYPALQQAVTTLHAHLVALQSVAPATAMRAFLKAVYASRQLHPRRESDTEFQTVAGHIDTALREIEDAPEACLPPDPLHQLALLRLQLEDARYHPVARRADFDLEGWLELPWNNAPNLIVTGMNEGSVPAAQPRDPFLPDTLCALLGLRHDAARLARDACLMSALVASRAADGTATFIAGKVSATGDPLKPSRLLFRCTDAELPHRAARLFGPADAQRTSVPSAISFQLNSAPPPDLPRNALPVTRLSVTAFRAYLACPFRYYLQHVLRMEPLDDARTGLDARDFGTLTHAVLQTMATSGMWRCDDPAKLGAYLDAEVHTWMHARFGAQPPVVVSLAAEAARQRLRAAARQQARLNADGWEIMHTEAKVTASLGAMRIVGKIDRIDRHRKTGRWRVIDYKTSDTAVDPAAAHLASVRPETPEWMRLKQEKPRRWVDLQLPIYVWLLRNGSMELPAHAPTPPPGEPWEQVEVGYFNLPKAVADTSLTLWDGLEETMLSSAADCAREIVHRITGQLFWPPAERVEFENFDSLVLVNAAACMQPPITPPAMAKDAS